MWITDKDDPKGFPVYASPAPTSHALEATIWPDENAVRVAEGVFWKDHDEMAGAAMHHAIAAYLRETSPALEANRELIASFMTRNSFSTGHGDTVEDLLSEFQWQLDERRQVIETLRAALESAKIKLNRYMEVHGPKGSGDLANTYVGGLWAEYQASLAVIDAALTQSARAKS
jgi:hypothetical protein